MNATARKVGCVVLLLLSSAVGKLRDPFSPHVRVRLLRPTASRSFVAERGYHTVAVDYVPLPAHSHCALQLHRHRGGERQLVQLSVAQITMSVLQLASRILLVHLHTDGIPELR